MTAFAVLLLLQICSTMMRHFHAFHDNRGNAALSCLADAYHNSKSFMHSVAAMAVRGVARDCCREQVAHCAHGTSWLSLSDVRPYEDIANHGQLKLVANSRSSPTCLSTRAPATSFSLTCSSTPHHVRSLLITGLTDADT
jgi:hypothetical protein